MGAGASGAGIAAGAEISATGAGASDAGNACEKTSANHDPTATPPVIRASHPGCIAGGAGTCATESELSSKTFKIEVCLD